MKITERSEGDVTILELKGSFVLGSGEDSYRDKMSELIGARRIRILLDFSGVEFIDSSGVGALVKSLTTITREGGTLKGLHPTPILQKVLKITGVYNLFEFFSDEKEALASF